LVRGLHYLLLMKQVSYFYISGLILLAASTAIAGLGGKGTFTKRNQPKSNVALPKAPSVTFKKETNASFAPDLTFIAPLRVQIGYEIFESYEGFLKSPYGSLSSHVPKVQTDKTKYLVAKIVSIVKKPATLFTNDENYTDAKIYDLFPAAHPRRIPGTDRFNCNLETGYSGLTLAGVESEILFTAYFNRITVTKQHQSFPEQNLFHFSRESEFATTFIFQPGVDYNFLMNSSLSAYSFSPCYAEVCGETYSSQEYTIITSYQIFGIKKSQPFILAYGSYLFEPGEGLPGTMVTNLKSSIPTLLERFYAIDQPVQTAEQPPEKR